MPVRYLMSILSLLSFLTINSSALPGQSIVAAQGLVAPQANATKSANGITVSLANVTVEQALATIAEKAGMRLTYSMRTPGLKKTINLNLKDATLSSALTRVLQGTGATAAVAPDGETIVVARVNTQQSGKSVQGVIAGRVVDGKTGKGISGVNISVENRSVTTDEDGSYRIADVGSGSHTVVVRLVGYAKQIRTVTVGSDSAVAADFKLEPSANVLDQVVVTGTVVQSELRSVPNAITVITAKQIEERGITRIDQLFRGEVPGLFALDAGPIGPSSGIGSLDEVVMFSRGATKMAVQPADVTVTTNSIKTYIDGVEMADSRYLSQIDPKSIERIEILTGPQASTIYGSNAINGVMQIFTKRGNSNRPRLSLNLLSGVTENNLDSRLTPSHSHSGSVSGLEGHWSYNAGGSWNYTGAWTPGKQIQRVSMDGSGRYEVGLFTMDLSARNGQTKNSIKGALNQVLTQLTQTGALQFFNGLVSPQKYALNGQTVGITLGYTPFSWWSHQVTAGNDRANIDRLGTGAAFRSGADTAYSNNQFRNSKVSQSYSSTLRLSLLNPVQATFTYGIDHWLQRTLQIDWQINAKAIVNPAITRPRTGKNTGGYLQGQLGIHDALFLTYGVRADWNPNFGNKAKVLPGRYGVSYTHEFGEISAKLRGSYGRSIRPPTPNLTQGIFVTLPALTNAFGSFYSPLPNPELGPEFQEGGEGGIEVYVGNRGSLIVTRYNQTVDGLINGVFPVDSVRALEPGEIPTVNCLTSSLASDGYCYALQSQYLNVGSIRNQGWELQSSINTGPLTTRGTYSWTKSRVIGITPKYRSLLNFNGFQPGATFDFIPEHTWAMNVSYTGKRTSISLNVNGTGTVLRRDGLTIITNSSTRLRFKDVLRFASPDGYREARAGYTTANVTATHQISGKVSASLQISNLTDFYRNDINITSPTAGRQTSVGLNIRL